VIRELNIKFWKGVVGNMAKLSLHWRGWCAITQCPGFLSGVKEKARNWRDLGGNALIVEKGGKKKFLLKRDQLLHSNNILRHQRDSLIPKSHIAFQY